MARKVGRKESEMAGRTSRMRAELIIAALGLLLFFVLFNPRLASAEKRSVTQKTVQGTVTGRIGDSISIEYLVDAKSGNAYEILLLLNPEVKIKHKKTVKEINMGDTVSATYDEIVTEDESGKKIERKLREISFVKAKPAEQAASGVLDSANRDTPDPGPEYDLQ